VSDDVRVAAALRQLTTVYRVRMGMLAFFSAICLTRGVAYIQYQDLPAGLDVVDRVVPIWVYALCWLLAAVAGFYMTLRQRRGVKLIAAQVALFTIWGWGYGLAWVLSNFGSADWIAASFYLCCAGVVSLLGFLPAQLRGK
jgi:hypothetical protein